MKPKVFIVSVIFFLLTCFAKCQTVATQLDKKDTLVKPGPPKIGIQYDSQYRVGCWYCQIAYREINCVVASTYEFNTTYKSTLYRDDIEHMAK